MENITILLNIFIAVLSFWVLFKLIGYGGTIGRSLSQIGYGIVIIGLSQFVETLGLVLLNANIATTEMVHRLILTIGFFFVAWGFGVLMRKNIPSQSN